MQRAAEWREGKFTSSGMRLRASSDREAVGVGSRLAVDVIGACYTVLVPRHCRGRLLDLGCGEVPLYGSYRGQVEETICADWPGTLHARRHIDVFCDLNRPLPFADARFDTVLLSDVLEHIAEPAPLIGEIARVLAPGGRLVMNVPFYYWLHEEPHDYYRYTAHALRRFVTLAGLRELELTPVGGAAEVVVDVMAKRLPAIPRIGRRASALLQALATRLLAPEPGALWTRPSAASFPLAYFVVAERP